MNDLVLGIVCLYINSVLVIPKKTSAWGFGGLWGVLSSLISVKMSCDMSNTDKVSLLCVSWTSPELRWNNFPHCEQEYGPSPVWYRRWTLNSGVTSILLQSLLSIWVARRQLLFLPTEDKRTWWQIKECLDAKWRRNEKLASRCILICPTWVCLAPVKRWNKTTAV